MTRIAALLTAPFLMAVLALWPALSQAGTVRVTSGEHGDFTRLVFEHGTDTRWALGTTPDGYELRLTGPDLSVDLANAFRLIGKGRLAAIEAAPLGDGASSVRLVLACPCHVQPFAFRPGTLVVDIRDGPPPATSAYEVPLSSVAQGSPLRPRPRPAPPAPEAASEAPAPVAEAPHSDAAQPALPPAPGEDPDALRASLLRELSDGAARGVIRMTLPDSATPEPAAPDIPQGHPQLRAGVDLGLVILPDSADRAAMTPAGRDCIASARVAIADWALAEPVSTHFAEARQSLLMEFDHTDQDALSRSVRAHLYLGFGAEAQQMITAFGSSHEDRAIWADMAAILDGAPASGAVFAGMAACDTDAAMWALLSGDAAASAPVDAAAVIRAFAALPPHLRQRFGAPLIGLFSERGDMSTVQSLQSALTRVLPPHEPDAHLIGADLALGAQDAAQAQHHAQAAVADHSRSAETAIVPLIESLAAQDKPVAPDQVVAVQALLREYAGTGEAAALRRALAIGAAASGDFDLAFATLPDAPDAAPEVWRLLARNAGDDAFLARSVLAAPDLPADLPAQRRKAVAERLLGLGFADQSLIWLDTAALPEGDRPAADRLAAQAHLARGDPLAALRQIAGQTDEAAAPIRAEAMAALPDPAAADATLGQLIAGQAWPRIAASEDATWSSAARWTLPVQGPPSTPGPVAAARRLLDDSRGMRADLATLTGAMRTPPDGTTGKTP